VGIVAHVGVCYHSHASSSWGFRVSRTFRSRAGSGEPCGGFPLRISLGDLVSCRLACPPAGTKKGRTRTSRTCAQFAQSEGYCVSRYCTGLRLEGNAKDRLALSLPLRYTGAASCSVIATRAESSPHGALPRVADLGRGNYANMPSFW
jgi:hypothetical protein